MLTPTVVRSRSRHLVNGSNKDKGTDIYTKKAAVKAGSQSRAFMNIY